MTTSQASCVSFSPFVLNTLSFMKPRLRPAPEQQSLEITRDRPVDIFLKDRKRLKIQ